MNPEQFNRSVNAAAKRLEQYALQQFPAMAGRKIIRFINGNFRAQGWQGDIFRKWKPIGRRGTILIRKGHLRRSIRQEVGPGSVRTWSSSPYAAIHNRGFRGTVSIKAHERRKYTATRISTGRFNKNGTERKKTLHVESGRTKVKAHSRKVNIAQRQFMPERWNDSKVLVGAIRRDVVKEIKNIFK